MSGPQESRADDDTGWADYHRQLWVLKNVQPNSLASWKINSTCVNIDHQLASARNRGLAAWVQEHGTVEHCPLPHPPAVLWLSRSPYPACLGCTWIASVLDLDRAAALAREHAAENLGNRPTTLLQSPLRVWRRDGPYDEPGPSWAGRAVGSEIDDAAQPDRSSDATPAPVAEADAAQPPRPTQWDG